MNMRIVGIAALLAAAVSPSIATASPEQASLKACAGAFAARLSSHGVEAPKIKIASLNVDSGSVAEFYAREFTFELTARDPRTGAAVARLTCSADRTGTVTSLSEITLPVVQPKLALQF
jgi:uncharacterized protein YfaQ (DUF2300 family)